MTILWVILGTIFVVLLVQNLVTGEKKIERRITHLYGVGDPQFLRSMGSLLGPPLLSGNSVRELVNGDQIFPAMLTAIRGAQKSVCFETFIYWAGEIGRELAEALAERANAGLKVHVLMDWLGAGKLDDDAVKLMADAGVRIEKYHPLHWYNLGRVNNRTHRKLLIVDGSIGFTGGVGIADNWRGDARNPDEWRDSHYRLEGPAVEQMQGAFMDNWMKTRGEVLHGDLYFPPPEQRGDYYAQVFKSSSTEGSESVRLMYLLSITRQTEIFEADKARSRRVTYEEWKRRPLHEKILEHTAGLFRSQL